jgi:hypothetical protein
VSRPELGSHSRTLLARNDAAHAAISTGLTSLLIRGYAAAAVFEWLLGASGDEPVRQPFRGDSEWVFWTTEVTPRFQDQTHEVPENGLLPAVWALASSMCAGPDGADFLSEGDDEGWWSRNDVAAHAARRAVLAGAALYWTSLMADLSPLDDPPVPYLPALLSLVATKGTPTLCPAV